MEKYVVSLMSIIRYHDKIQIQLTAVSARAGNKIINGCLCMLESMQGFKFEIAYENCKTCHFQV